MRGLVKYYYWTLATVFVSISFPVLALKPLPPRKITSGEYISKGGRGVMTITATKNSMASFGIQSGSERGVCDLMGQIKQNKAVLATELDGKTCSIRFSVKENTIEVIGDDSEACRSFCGVHADFSGVYMMPVSECGRTEIAKADQNFNRFYEKKAYKKALESIKPLLINCVETSVWVENAERRKNAAMALYQLKRFDECLQVLEPLRQDAEKSNEVVAEEHMPIEGQVYIRILEHARKHLELCSAKK